MTSDAKRARLMAYPTAAAAMEAIMRSTDKKAPIGISPDGSMPSRVASRLILAPAVDGGDALNPARLAEDIPLITVEGLSAGMYPSYLSLLVRATLAAMSVSAGVGDHVNTNHAMQHVVGCVVGVRAGVWAATGFVPEQRGSHADLQYSMGTVDLTASEDEPAAGSWATAMINQQICGESVGAASIFACNASTEYFRAAVHDTAGGALPGPVPDIEASVNRYMFVKLGAAAYERAQLGSAATAAILMSATLEGIPVAFAEALARDSMFTLRSARRLLLTRRELEWSEYKEKLFYEVRKGPLPDAWGECQAGTATDADAMLTEAAGGPF
jgi:hypothetical protein